MSNPNKSFKRQASQRIISRMTLNDPSIECDKRNRKYTNLSIENPIDIICTYSSSLCSICLEIPKFSQRHYLSCGHFFHEECILVWLTHSNNCPICKKSLEVKLRAKKQLEEEGSNILENENGPSSNLVNNGINSSSIHSRYSGVECLRRESVTFLMLAMCFLISLLKLIVVLFVYKKDNSHL